MPHVLRIVASADKPDTASAPFQLSSSKRLLRDLKDFYRDPYPGIQLHYLGAFPGTPVRRWCPSCNSSKCSCRRNNSSPPFAKACLVLTPSSGPFEAIPIHFSLIVPDGFPAEPPKIEVSTAIKHPHVYGGWICADILTNYGDGAGYVGGYTPAYTLFGVALQILSFFTNETLENDHSKKLSVLSYHWKLEDILKVPYSSEVFVCKDCGYNGHDILEELSETVNSRNDKRNLSKSKPGANPLTSNILATESNNTIAKIPLENGYEITKKSYLTLLRLPVEIWLAIASHLPTSSIPLATSALPVFRNILKSHNILTRRELVCFYTKFTFTESILGFGVHVEPEGSQSFMISEFEYLSFTAFSNSMIRKSVWKKPFEFFIPFALNDHHFTRALPILRVCVRKLGEVVLVPKFMTRQVLDRPNVALQLLVKMMNNVVVSLFRISGTAKEKHVLIAASEKAVQGYVSLLHLALSLVKKFPVLVEEIEERVSAFVDNPSERGKSRTPDLGEWLIYLGLSDEYTWSPKVAKVLLPQFFARNVMWMFRSVVPKGEGPTGITPTSHPYLHLALLEKSDICEVRLKDTFTASATSLRLLLFQVFFLTKILRPCESTTRMTIYNSLEKRLGRPPGEMLTSAFNAIKVVKGVDGYGRFCGLVGAGVEKMGKEGMCSMLKEAVKDSERVGYHRLPRGVSREVLVWLRDVAERKMKKESG